MPRIAIPIPWADDDAYSQRAWPEYARAVAEASGEAVEIPLTASEKQVIDLAATCDAVLLPGSGADVDPVRYGQPRIPECNPADPARDAVDRLLLEDAYRYRKPILGICMGVQSLNVFRGGSLIQDLSPIPVNHRAGRTVATAHIAQIKADTLLGSLVAQHPEEAPIREGSPRLPINSSHHQALQAIGDGLRLAAISPEDGVIEAVEGSTKDHFVLGVQWHPERTTDLSPTSRAIFTRFLTAAAAWHNTHPRT